MLPTPSPLFSSLLSHSFLCFYLRLSEQQWSRRGRGVVVVQWSRNSHAVVAQWWCGGCAVFWWCSRNVLLVFAQCSSGVRASGVFVRAVKMGWNPRANLAHHGFGSGWVETFLQISVWVNF